MNEGYNYQLLTGIVKVIRPSGKPVLGIADGQGQFMWLPTEKIIMSHPMQYENWQTTIFALVADWQITWKAEQKWEQFKDSYPNNTKPILQPIPDMFKGSQMPTPLVQQGTATQPINYPQSSTATQPANSPQQTTTVPQVPQVPQVTPTTPTVVNFSSTPDTLQTIATELTNIRKLLELYIKPPKLSTADDLLITKEQVAEQYGAPPLSDLDMKLKAQGNVNKDVLPNIFGD